MGLDWTPFKLATQVYSQTVCSTACLGSRLRLPQSYGRDSTSHNRVNFIAFDFFAKDRDRDREKQAQTEDWTDLVAVNAQGLKELQSTAETNNTDQSSRLLLCIHGLDFGCGGCDGNCCCCGHAGGTRCWCCRLWRCDGLQQKHHHQHDIQLLYRISSQSAKTKSQRFRSDRSLAQLPWS